MSTLDHDLDLAAELPLHDPTFYDQDLDAIHGALRRARRRAPVFWHEPGGFWVLLKHEDQRFVGTNPQIFSSRFGFQIADTYDPERVMGALAPWAQEQLRSGSLSAPRRRGLIARAKVSMGDPEIVSIVVTDPPRHQQLRRIMTNAMSPRLIRSIEPTIERIVDSALDRVAAGEAVDLVGTVAAPIPPLVIASLLGVPVEEHEDFLRWANAFMAVIMLTEPERAKENRRLAAELAAYIERLVEQRRRHPRDDLLSGMVHADLDGEPPSDLILKMLTRSVIGGGSETTLHLLSQLVYALGLRPDQRRMVIERPALADNAVQESLRYHPHVWCQCRTAQSEVEIRGRTIRPGDFVVKVLPSANRDEDVWERPDEFDVERRFSVPQMSFGWGEHHCPGNPLARTEGRIFLRRFLARFPDFRLDGAPSWFKTPFLHGLRTLPVRL